MHAEGILGTGAVGTYLWLSRIMMIVIAMAVARVERVGAERMGIGDIVYVLLVMIAWSVVVVVVVRLVRWDPAWGRREAVEGVAVWAFLVEVVEDSSSWLIIATIVIVCRHVCFCIYVEILRISSKDIDELSSLNSRLGMGLPVQEKQYS